MKVSERKNIPHRIERNVRLCVRIEKRMATTFHSPRKDGHDAYGITSSGNRQRLLVPFFLQSSPRVTNRHQSSPIVTKSFRLPTIINHVTIFYRKHNRNTIYVDLSLKADLRNGNKEESPFSTDVPYPFYGCTVSFPQPDYQPP